MVGLPGFLDVYSFFPSLPPNHFSACAFRHRSSIWIADFAAIFTPPTACRATAFHSAAFKRRRSDRTPGSGRQVGGVSRYGQHCELLTLEQPRPYAPAGLVDELLWAVACLSQLHERLLERRLHHFLEHWPDHTRVHRAHPEVWRRAAAAQHQEARKRILS